MAASARGLVLYTQFVGRPAQLLDFSLKPEPADGPLLKHL